jgi:DNA-binding transcriptional MerR regulator
MVIVAKKEVLVEKIYSPKEVIRQTGLSIHTLRYYENLGLIDPVSRADNGHRRYREADILRIEFLKRLRATGMPISEMQHYVELYREGDTTLLERLEILAEHRKKIEEKIDELKETLIFIDSKITRYHHELGEKEAIKTHFRRGVSAATPKNRSKK